MPNLQATDRKEIIARLELSRELERREKENGVKWFIPTGKQADFIGKIGGGEVFVGVYSGGNRAGKTGLAINILGNILFGKQNPYFDYPIFKSWPFPKRARIGSNPKDLSDIGSIETEINSWWPKGRWTVESGWKTEGRYEAEKGGKTYHSLYKTDTDWVMDVMSYEQDRKEWESVSLGLAIFNEPPPEPIFKATVARMEHGGMILIFMTPLDEAQYLFDSILENNDGLKTSHRVAVIYTDIEDSCKTHGIRGFLDHDKIEQMISFYDPDEKDARAHGKPMHLSGRVYSLFNDAVHVVNDFPIPSEWIRINIVDPHDSIPFAMSWMAMSPSEDFYVYDESPEEKFEQIKNTNLTFGDYAGIIRAKEGRQKIHFRLMDPNFGNKRYGNTGRTVAEEMREFGLDYDTDINDSLDIGHHVVREMLKYDPLRPLSAINKPKLFILRKCRNHWVSMRKYGRKSSKSDELKDNPRLVETYKHFCDLIRYAMVSKHLLKFTNIDEVWGRGNGDKINKFIHAGSARGGW